jgi:Ni,Fe-hydrogenase III component G
MFEQPLDLIAPWVNAQSQPEANRIDVTVDAADLVSAVRVLSDIGWGYLAAITGLDLGATAGEIEVLYHFCAGPAVLTLRVRVPRDAAEVPSLCGVTASSRIYEQELREMLGVKVAGLPDTGYLFLPDDWREGDYPLRKTDLSG